MYNVDSILDAIIDYDSSFELVDAEDSDEIEIRNDITQEINPLISVQDEMIKEEVAVCMQDQNIMPIPITTAILGKWSLHSSENLNAYFEAQKLTEQAQNAWKNGIACYQMKHGLLFLHAELPDEPFTAPTLIEMEKRTISPQYCTVTRIENNSLITICTRRSTSSEEWKVERSVQNDYLIVVNTKGSVRCTRTYQRVI